MVHFLLFGPDYQQWDIRLFFEQNSHIHLCFQARISDESQLAPATPQTASYKMKRVKWMSQRTHPLQSFACIAMQMVLLAVMVTSLLHSLVMHSYVTTLTQIEWTILQLKQS